MVNVGYLLMRWSNGRWKNTVHRVVEPPSLLREPGSANELESPRSGGLSGGHSDDTTPARYSIPFFAAPDPETVVEALPGCWSEEAPKWWKPLNAGEYLRRKREGVYV